VLWRPGGGRWASPRFGRSPLDEVRRAARERPTVIVIEKAFSVGYGGCALGRRRLSHARRHDFGFTPFVAGLGGRAITQASLEAILDDAVHGRLDSVTFLDLDLDIVESERTG